MPIRTQSLEEAARKYIESYQAHLKINSAASRLDPRQCNQCSSAFEDLIFALDGANTSPEPFARPSIDDWIIDLFGNKALGNL